MKEYYLNILTNELYGPLILTLLLLVVFILSTTKFDFIGILRFSILALIVNGIYLNYRDYYIVNGFTDEPKHKESFKEFSEK